MASYDPGATPPTVVQQAPPNPYQIAYPDSAPSYPQQQTLQPYQPYQPQAYQQPAYGYPPAYVTNTRPPVSGGLVAVAWIVAVFTLLYMLPWAIAVTRNRSNMVAIGLINFFLGWSFLGWVAALVMACGSEQTTQVVVVNQPNYHLR